MGREHSFHSINHDLTRKKKPVIRAWHCWGRWIPGRKLPGSDTHQKNQKGEVTVSQTAALARSTVNSQTAILQDKYLNKMCFQLYSLMIITGSPPVIASMCLYLLSSCRLINLRFRRCRIVNVSDKRRDTTVLNKLLILPISPDSFSVNFSAMWRVRL